MATMGTYCKAYLISDFRKYDKWREKMPIQPMPPDVDAATGEPAAEADEEPYLFLQENFVVTQGIFLDEQIVFDDTTPEWEQFCKEQLQFAVPDFSLPAPEAEAAS